MDFVHYAGIRPGEREEQEQREDQKEEEQRKSVKSGRKIEKFSALGGGGCCCCSISIKLTFKLSLDTSLLHHIHTHKPIYSPRLLFTCLLVCWPV